MKILITGGAGFVGGNLSILLAEKGHEVLSFDNLSRRGSELNLLRFEEHKNIKFVHGDIRNEEDFLNLAFKPDVVLECAAQTTAIDGYNNPIYDVTNNLYSVVNVLEYCRKHQAGLIFWSTNKTYSGDLVNSVPLIEKDTRYEWATGTDFSLKGWSEKGFSTDLDINGNQHTIYGVSKIAADLVCQEWSYAFDIPILINRFSCLYGPHQFGKVSQGWIVWFAIAKLLGKPLTAYGFNGKQVRDYLYIEDLFNLVEKQLDSIQNYRGSYYNVGGGIENTISLLELSNLLDNLLDLRTKEFLFEEPRRSDQIIYISDIDKVSRDFNWKPETRLESGLTNIIKWVKENKNNLGKFQ